MANSDFFYNDSHYTHEEKTMQTEHTHTHTAYMHFLDLTYN